MSSLSRGSSSWVRRNALVTLEVDLAGDGGSAAEVLTAGAVILSLPTFSFVAIASGVGAVELVEAEGDEFRP